MPECVPKARAAKSAAAVPAVVTAPSNHVARTTAGFSACAAAVAGLPEMQILELGSPAGNAVLLHAGRSDLSCWSRYLMLAAT